jgi:hypothetical protein
MMVDMGRHRGRRLNGPSDRPERPRSRPLLCKLGRHNTFADDCTDAVSGRVARQSVTVLSEGPTVRLLMPTRHQIVHNPSLTIARALVEGLATREDKERPTCVLRVGQVWGSESSGFYAD